MIEHKIRYRLFVFQSCAYKSISLKYFLKLEMLKENLSKEITPQEAQFVISVV